MVHANRSEHGKKVVHTSKSGQKKPEHGNGTVYTSKSGKNNKSEHYENTGYANETEHIKEEWRPGNMLYPIPAVLVSVRGTDGRDNLLTVAWTGTVCSDPVMLSISVRPSRYSYHMLMETGEFVVNLTTRDLVRATDYCGVRSGANEDKWAVCGLHKQEAAHVNVPMVKESPVNIECKVEEVHEYGSHTMFVARVLAVHADKAYMDDKGRFDLTRANPIVYSHGEYFELGRKLGKFGFSVQKSCH